MSYQSKLLESSGTKRINNESILTEEEEKNYCTRFAFLLKKKEEEAETNLDHDRIRRADRMLPSLD